MKTKLSDTIFIEDFLLELLFKNLYKYKFHVDHEKIQKKETNFVGKK